MADWFLANVPGGKDLVLDTWNTCDEEERLSAPLGPYREQAQTLERHSVQRFMPEEYKSPPLEEVLASIDREETAIVPALDIAAQFEQERSEAAVVWQEFEALSQSSSAEASAASSSTVAYDSSGALAKMPSQNERERAEWFGVTPLAKNLRIAEGVDLNKIVALNPAEEGERIGFTPHRMTEHLSEVEKQMQERLENRMGWRAIKDAEVDEQLKRMGRNARPQGRRRGRASGGLVHGLNLPKAKPKGAPGSLLQVSAGVPTDEKKNKKKKKSGKKELITLEVVEEKEEESEDEEVEDAQCSECGIYGVMTRCRRCQALLCSMTCREEHNASTCSSKLLGGASSSGSSAEEVAASDEAIVVPEASPPEQVCPEGSQDTQAQASQVLSLEQILANLDRDEELDGQAACPTDENAPRLEGTLPAQDTSSPEDEIPGLDDLLARLDRDSMDTT